MWWVEWGKTPYIVAFEAAHESEKRAGFGLFGEDSVLA